MHRLFSTLIFFFCSGIFVFGQGTGKKTSVDGQILYEIKGDKLHIKANCENLTGKKLNLTYKLKIDQSDSRGNQISNSQGGKKEVAASASKTLSTSTVSWGQGSTVTITLDIFHKKKRLDSDTLELSQETE